MFQQRIRERHGAGIIAVLLLCVGLIGTAHAADLDSVVPRLMALGDVPGLSVAVVSGDSISWSGAFGIRNTRADGRVDEETVFEAASLSKTLFSYVVLRLADRGAIDLDTPLVTYAPYARLAGDPRHRRVTARMCLSHTSGLPNWGTRFAAEPGTRFIYSGEGIRFLRMTVETVTGLSLEALVRREAFEPLGMDRSSYLWHDSYAANVASGHDNEGSPQPRRRCVAGSAAASLRTTARDYARFLQACLTGEGLSPDMGAEMIRLQTRADFGAAPEIARHVGWGLGWGVMDGDDGPLIWQWGDNGDTVALAVGCPARGDGVVYFANSATGLSIAHDIVASVLPDRPWCLDALGYQRYDGPQRVHWFEVMARQALAAGHLAPAGDALEFLLELRPNHGWARTQLMQVRQRQAAARTSARGHS